MVLGELGDTSSLDKFARPWGGEYVGRFGEYYNTTLRVLC